MGGLHPSTILRNTFVRNVEHLEEVTSTQDVARQRATIPETTLPLLVVADRQTAGRGRDDRRWWTGEGNLAFSLVLESPLPLQQEGLPLVSLGAAVAVVEALQPLLESIRVGIHWPNDVLAADRKLSGILVHGTVRRRLVIGIGINLAGRLDNAPADVQVRAATLEDLAGKAPDREAVLIGVLKRLDAVFSTLADDPAEIGRRADACCLQRGSLLAVRTTGTSVEGRCLGISADGGLILETPAGQRVIYAGSLAGG